MVLTSREPVGPTHMGGAGDSSCGQRESHPDSFERSTHSNREWDAFTFLEAVHPNGVFSSSR